MSLFRLALVSCSLATSTAWAGDQPAGGAPPTAKEGTLDARLLALTAEISDHPILVTWSSFDAQERIRAVVDRHPELVGRLDVARVGADGQAATASRLERRGWSCGVFVGVTTFAEVGPCEAPVGTGVQQSSSVGGHPAVPARNAAFVELGGSGLYWTLNYETHLADRFVLRAGAGFTPVSTLFGDFDLFMAPVTASWVSPSHRGHGVEVGVGGTIAVLSGGTGLFESSEPSVDVVGTAVAGYRFQPVQGGVQFRAVFTPLFSPYSFQPWGGVSAGYAF